MIVTHPDFGAMPLERYDRFVRHAITEMATGMLTRLRTATLLTDEDHDPGDEDRSAS